MKKIGFILVLLLLFTACEEQKRVVQKVDGGQTPAKLALLIPNNLSNDLLGGYVERNLLYKELAKNSKGYQILDIQKTDEILHNEGITDGGQLEIFHPLELCQLLQVDGLIYLDVYDMGMKTFPFYHSRYLDVQVRMFNFEKFIWQRPVKIANRYMDLDGAKKAIKEIKEGDTKQALKRAGESVAVQTVIKLGTATLFEHELKPEMLMSIKDITAHMPRGSLNAKGYVQKVNNRLAKLNAQVKAGEELVTEEERNKVREEQEVKTNEIGENVIDY